MFVLNPDSLGQLINYELNITNGLQSKAVGIIFQSGGRIRELTPHQWDEAESAYKLIRAMKDDALIISKNANMPEFIIQRIKNHIFYKNNHILDRGIGKLDADPLISNAWNRLLKGTHTDFDLQLLRHEYLESKFESIYQTTNRVAHEIVSTRNPSGLDIVEQQMLKQMEKNKWDYTL